MLSVAHCFEQSTVSDWQHSTVITHSALRKASLLLIFLDKSLRGAAEPLAGTQVHIMDMEELV